MIGFLNMLMKDVGIVDVEFIPTEHPGLAEAHAGVARKMLAAGMPVEQICEFIGLTADAVESLK